MFVHSSHHLDSDIHISQGTEVCRVCVFVVLVVRFLFWFGFWLLTGLFYASLYSKNYKTQVPRGDVCS